MTDRHARTPYDTFLSDQALAYAREQAETPGTLAVVLDYATPGQQCTWCDCPDGLNSPHNDTRFRCSGCPSHAYYVVHAVAGTRQSDIPMCKAHHSDFVAMLAPLIGQ